MELVTTSGGATGSGKVSAPIWHAETKTIYAVAGETGDVVQLSRQDDSGSGRSPRAPVWQVVLNTGGCPSSVQFDAANVMYVADMAHQAVLYMQTDGSLTELVREWESEALLGPNQLLFDDAGTLYFTDSGPLGTTGISDPRGSVFSVDADTGIVRPLAWRCLAHPSGLAFSASQQRLFVAETAANRLLRFAQRPSGAWHASVFHTFSGYLGPSSVVVHADRLLVARFDFAVSGPSDTEQGCVSVLSQTTGQHLLDVMVPGLELTGVCIASSIVYVTEASGAALLRATDPVSMIGEADQDMHVDEEQDAKLQLGLVRDAAGTSSRKSVSFNRNASGSSLGNSEAA